MRYIVVNHRGVPQRRHGDRFTDCEPSYREEYKKLSDAAKAVERVNGREGFEWYEVRGA